MKKITNLAKTIIRKQTGSNRRRSSAGRFITSSAGAVTSLILMVTLSFLTSAFLNLFGFWGLVGTNNTYALDRISMTIDTNNLAIGVVDISTEGKFSQSGNMNISVSTSNYYGYTLSMASSTGSTDLVSNTSTISSINASIDQATFSDAANTQYSNKWGYKPSTLYDVTNDVSAANTNFLPLPDDTGEIIDKTSEANSTPNTYTLSIGTRIDNTASIGDYISDAFVIAAVANTNTIPCDDTKLCVEYDGNGLMYDNDWLNRVNYNSTTTQEQITKYSHTPNISDAGVQDGNYANNYTMNDVVTIDGATSLHIKLTYGGESASYDWVSFWPGNHPDYTASGNYSTGVQNCGGGTVTNGKYGGTNGTTVECDITTSDGSVTFAFKSDGGGVGNGYGYYAIITGIGTVIQRSVSSGEYATPTGTNALFYGWSMTETTPGGGLPSQVEYTNESEVMTKIPGDEGEVKTLYAVWQQGQTITFTKDSNVSSIVVLDSDGNTVGTITDSGQNLILYQGSTYTLKPTHVLSYTTDTITKTTGEGIISGKQFTVGAGSATINVTSRQLSPIQDFNCSTLLNIGDTEEVYDTRDNEVYLIGKLADNKCWMLDNLRLDLTNSDIVDGLTSTNTNASDEALGYLKGTTTPRDPSTDSTGKWPTAALTRSNWTASYSYSAPLVNVSGTFSGNPYTKDTVVTSYGDGSGKIGVYYNYCAASAGSYCYGNGTQNTGSPTSDPNPDSLRDITDDICPKGWRMPTSSSSGEYQALYNAYSSASEGQQNAFRANLSTPLSGYFGSSGSANFQGSYGYFWSSTWSKTNSMYLLGVGASLVTPSDYNNRHTGDSVRCTLDS